MTVGDWVQERPSPVHATSAPGVRWSTVNFAEAIQGVQTPLGWTLWSHVMERAIRRAFGELGALPRAEVPPTGRADTSISAAFFGYAAGNVSVFRRIGDAMPGTSGDAVAEQLFGEPRPATATPAGPGSRRRYPVVAVRMPIAAVRAVRALPGVREDYARWWRRSVIERPPTTTDEAAALLADGARRWIDIGVHHTVVTLVGQGLADQVGALARAAFGGRDGAAELMTGYGALEESLLMADLCDVADGAMPMAEFLARHGFHGPDEGQLTSRVWREDPVPLQRLADRYQVTQPERPHTREAAQRIRRQAAERRLLATLTPAGRMRARLVLRLAERVIPMREVGKAGFLQALDGCRCAARVLGERLTEAGRIDRPDDVFFLTFDELVTGVDGPAQQTVAVRRADHEQFAALELPAAWHGVPEPRPRTVTTRSASPVSAVGELTGIPIGGDPVTGIARVITDPGRADLEDGEILVCGTTDPSWTPLFLIAEALVVDTGGAMSHGAIVARELGITCVVNTGTGTRDIPDGAVITVDGRTGTVSIQAGSLRHPIRPPT